MILALDLGTHTGFAISNDGDNNIIGTWEFKNSRHEGGGSRFLRFRKQLHDLHAHSPIGRVFYEEVRRHLGTDAAHIYGGLLATLTTFCEEHGIPYEGVPVGTIKKFWTGKGNATKAEMIARAEQDGAEVDNDNEADALAILRWAFANRVVQKVVETAVALPTT